ncbi:MAG: T9SS type A sorting domain-containing protein, partial [Bacteroidota bacterium]
VEAFFTTPPNSTSVGAGLSTSMAGLYWEIQRGSGSGNVTAQLFYKETTSTSTPDNDMIADGGHLRLIQHDGSSTWQNLGLAANNSDMANLSSITGTISSFIGTNDYSTIGSMTATTVLPVELTTFTVSENDGNALLEWSTATELNNEKFEIGHSIDGISFDNIGTAEGSGTTNDPKSYRFQHQTPSAGHNYYRLKQVDYDGKYEYSHVIQLEVDQLSSSLRLFHNPLVNHLLRFSYESSTVPLIQITNLSGEQVYFQKPPAVETMYELDLRKLATGIYLLKVNEETRRIILE